MIVYLCVCRLPRAFIDCCEVQIPHFICVVPYLDIVAEIGDFNPTTHIDKLVIFQIPKFSNSLWKKLYPVKIFDTLTFVDEPPQYYLPNCSPPPFFLIPPSLTNVPPTQRAPTRRQLFPIPMEGQEIPTYYLR